MFVIQDVIFQLEREGIREKENGDGKGGDYSRQAIVLNISVKEGRLFEGGD